MKKIIANSSIAHMAFALLGLFTFNDFGLYGTLYLILGHGIVSALAFFCIGILYDRKHTRILYYLIGTQKYSWRMAITFFLAVLGNIAFPLTVNFIGEFYILAALNAVNSFFCFCIALTTLLTVAYSLLL
jgi:NADH:ubiquinone oxidoreductase subunit 4 (subunit M)